MKVQVVTINTVSKSSKSELSSGTFGHLKVCEEANPGGPSQIPPLGDYDANLSWAAFMTMMHITTYTYYE